MTAGGFDALAGAIMARRSVRRFSAAAVDRGDIERAITLATWAPSAGGRQDWHFSVVTNDGLKHEMAAVVRRAWNETSARHADSGCLAEIAAYGDHLLVFEHAPVVIAVSARRPGQFQNEVLGDQARGVSGSFASAAMAAQNLLLALEALGLRACCLTAPLIAADQIVSLLQLGRRRELVCLIAAGHPAETPGAPARKPFADIARFHD